jgi:hypothetical protein
LVARRALSCYYIIRHNLSFQKIVFRAMRPPRADS